MVGARSGISVALKEIDGRVNDTGAGRYSRGEAFAMFEIRSDQVQALRPIETALVDRIVVQLRQRFPEWCAERSEAKLRGFVVCGCEDAVLLGFEREEDITRLVCVFVIFGRDFIEDERMGWAARYLDRKSSMPAPIRIQLLHDRVMKMVGAPLAPAIDERPRVSA